MATAMISFISKSNGITNEYKSIAPTHEYTKLRVSSNEYDHETIINTNLVNELQKFSWYKHTSGALKGTYFVANIITNEHRVLVDRFPIFATVERSILLHRYIACLASLPKGDNASYVDHISRNVFDNRVVNLRWATQALQNINQDKKRRQCIARPLPDDIPGPLPKYITWNVEKYAPEKTRSFFRIECHPGLALIGKKSWETSKSNKVSNPDKLEQAKQKVFELNQVANGDAEEPLRARLNAEFGALIA